MFSSFDDYGLDFRPQTDFRLMHNITTKHEFLRLRRAGLSFARIGRQLGVSKPTLSALSRQCRHEIDSQIAEDQQRVIHGITASTNQELADLRKRNNALRQELFSRALREIPTEHLETLAGELRQRIQYLEASPGSRHEEAQISLPSPIQHPASNIQHAESAQDSTPRTPHSALVTPNQT